MKRLNKSTLRMEDFCKIEDEGGSSLFQSPLQVQALMDKDKDKYLLIAHSSSIFFQTTKYYEVNRAGGKLNEFEYDYENYYVEELEKITPFDHTNLKNITYSILIPEEAASLDSMVSEVDTNYRVGNN